MSPTPKQIERAADVLRDCLRDPHGVVVVAAGAGMGVDSGLPDFRGPEGFWNAYPPYRHLGLSFMDLASSHWFDEDPALAWGFYGHRFHLYQKTVPHEGYSIVKAFADRAGGGHVVFTSNVDGAFDKAGFAADRVAEVHGAINTLQCTVGQHGLWPAGDLQIEVDPETFRAVGPFPRCRCGAIARPNILMFSDGGWDDARTDLQLERLNVFLNAVERFGPVVVVECGAGRAIPSVRRFSESVVRRNPGAWLVRINVREEGADADDVKDRVIGVADGARAALVALRDLC